MAKKFDLSESSIFKGDQPEESVKKKAGRPVKNDIVRNDSRQEGLTKDWTRATFIVRVDLLEKVKDYAYTERMSITECIYEAMSEYAEKHISGKKILHRPESKKWDKE